MRIYIKVKLGCSKSKVESFGGNRYFIYLVSENQEEGNEELFSLLSRYLVVPVSRIFIKAGFDKNDKMLEVL